MKKLTRLILLCLLLSAHTVADAPFYPSNFIGFETFPSGCLNVFGNCGGSLPP